MLSVEITLELDNFVPAAVGARRPEQIEETADAATKTLSPELIQAVEKLLAERDTFLAKR